jgi:hypothetical protein
MTTKYTEFNKNNLKEIRGHIDQALATLSKYGIMAKMGNIRFDKDSFKTDLTVKIEGAASEYEKEFKRKYMYYDFKGDEVGKLFFRNNDTYEFLGFRPRARVQIALVKCLNDERQYMIDASEALRLLTEYGRIEK